MILIVGASGMLGSAVTRRLLAEGKQIRVLTRNPLSLVHLEKRGAEVVDGDLRDSVALKAACQGVDQVLAAAHALDGKGDNNPHSVDDIGNRQLIDAAKDSGIRHFIFISALGASPDSPIEFFRIKYAVENYLQDSGLTYTILRPSAYMDRWGLEIGAPILKQGKVRIFGSGRQPINFVAVDDVANFVCLALEDRRADNRIIEIGGPQDLTMNQVVDIFEQLGNRQVKKSHVPLPAMRVMSILMRPINPTLSRLIRMGIYMETTDQRFDMSGTHKEFPFPLTRFDTWAQDHSTIL